VLHHRAPPTNAPPSPPTNTHPQNNVAWAYNLEDGSLTRIVSAPQKAEISGIYDFTVGAFSYLTMAFQHPGDLEGAALGYSKAQLDAQRGYMVRVVVFLRACVRACVRARARMSTIITPPPHGGIIIVVEYNYLCR